MPTTPGLRAERSWFRPVSPPSPRSCYLSRLPRVFWRGTSTWCNIQKCRAAATSAASSSRSCLSRICARFSAKFGVEPDVAERGDRRDHRGDVRRLGVDWVHCPGSNLRASSPQWQPHGSKLDRGQDLGCSSIRSATEFFRYTRRLYEEHIRDSNSCARVSVCSGHSRRDRYAAGLGVRDAPDAATPSAASAGRRQSETPFWQHCTVHVDSDP